MYIASIRLTNIRAFKYLTIPPEGTTMPRQATVIGGNSTCKTSILRSVALGLCSETHAAALLSELPGSLVGPFDDKAEIEVVLSSEKGNDSTTIKTTIRSRSVGHQGGVLPEKKQLPIKEVQSEDNGKQDAKEDYIVKQERSPSSYDRGVFVCGYGAGRISIGTESWTRYRIIDSVYTLFRYDQSLQNPELILHRLRTFYRDIEMETRKRLLRLLGLSSAHEFELTNRGITVSGPSIGGTVPLDAVADGYRTTFTWLCDLVGWAMLSDSIDTKSGNIRGVVLIDEIEQHLHPTIQISLLQRLKTVYPDLQLVTTSHSPITALYTKPQGLYALKRRGKTVDLLPSHGELGYFSVDDVFADEWLFDTDPDGPQLRKLMQRYERIAKVPVSQRSQAQNEELEELSERIISRQPGRLATKSTMLEGLQKLRKDLGL